MKRLGLAASLLLCAFAANPEVRNVKTVYILKMANGIDQYLASELTQHAVYAVTTDPQRADALLSDSVGEAFEQKYAELYPPPKPAESEKKEDEGKKKPENSADLLSSMQAPARAGSSWSRGHGTIFLVDRKSRGILWSTQQQLKTRTRPELIKFARNVTMQLRKDLGMATEPK